MTAPSASSDGRGLFITLEGIDGAGKSSHLDRIESALVAAGRRVLRTREPGGTPLGEQLRDMVLQQAMDALTEALLVFAARREHVLQVIRPALAAGQTVLCDRFTDATFAYQGGGRGFDLTVLSKLEHWVQAQQAPATDSVLQPDLTLWFDLPPSVAAARLADARAPDRFEAQPAAFFERVAVGYARRAAEAPRRFARIDADVAREVVAQQIDDVLRQRGWIA